MERQKSAALAKASPNDLFPFLAKECSLLSGRLSGIAYQHATGLDGQTFISDAVAILDAMGEALSTMRPEAIRKAGESIAKRFTPTTTTKG